MLLISYFGNEAKFELEKFTPFSILIKDLKWERSKQFLSKLHDIWQNMMQLGSMMMTYRIRDVQTLNRFFELFHENNFDLAQPSLNHRSYFPWALLLQNSTILNIEKTNFVEVMIPCFSKKHLKKCTQLFQKKIWMGVRFFMAPTNSR